MVWGKTYSFISEISGYVKKNVRFLQLFLELLWGDAVPLVSVKF